MPEPTSILGSAMDNFASISNEWAEHFAVRLEIAADTLEVARRAAQIGAWDLSQGAASSGFEQLVWEPRRVQHGAKIFSAPTYTTYDLRRSLVPAAPAMLRLSEVLSSLEKMLPEMPFPPLGSAPTGPLTLKYENGQTVEYPAETEPCANEFEFIQNEVKLASDRVSQITKLYGDPAAWIKSPNLQTCTALLRSIEVGEPDYYDLLRWFVDTSLNLGKYLDPYVAQILWTMTPARVATFHSARNKCWCAWPETDVLRKLRSAAIRRKVKDDCGVPPLRLGELVPVPVEELDRQGRLQTNILGALYTGTKLCDAVDTVQRLEAIEEYLGLGLTIEECNYVLLKKVKGLTQIETRRQLGLGLQEFDRIRRSADRKIRSSRRPGLNKSTARPKEWFKCSRSGVEDLKSLQMLTSSDESANVGNYEN